MTWPTIPVRSHDYLITNYTSNSDLTHSQPLTERSSYNKIVRTNRINRNLQPAVIVNDNVTDKPTN